MIIVEAEAKKWGNSLGLIIPREVVEEEQIKEHTKMRVLLVKGGRAALKSTFGIAHGKLKNTTQRIKDELRRELYG
ncbi:MAG: hypothetical protein AABX47_04220 [Nanoarchaeota archaeon]